MRLARAIREIPESRMSQLPTNPILDRSGTSVLTGEYQQDSPSMLLRATRPHSPLDASPVISTPKLSCRQINKGEQSEQSKIACQLQRSLYRRRTRGYDHHSFIIEMSETCGTECQSKPSGKRGAVNFKGVDCGFMRILAVMQLDIREDVCSPSV